MIPEQLTLRGITFPSALFCAPMVGITHSDQGGWQTRQMVSRELVAMGLPPTAMDTDARSRAHMATLVEALIYGIDPFNNAEE